MNDNIPELKIEYMKDGMGDGLILLEQDCGGNIDRVGIHPIHLRYMAEKMGLAPTSDPQAHKTIAMLTRRLLVLRDRICDLTICLAEHSDHEHADLSYELTFSTATAEIANEFCADLGTAVPDSRKSILPGNNPIETQIKPGASQPALI
jgi:hypothetical protein